MAKQNINIGSSANKGDGDPLRTAFTKINSNFTELYDAVGLNDGLVNIGSLEFNGSTITTTDSSQIEIAQEVRITSDLTMQGSIVPSINDRFDLGSSSNQWRSLYVSSDTIFIGGVPLAVDNQGNLTVDGNSVGGGNVDLSNYQAGNDDIRLESNGEIVILSDGLTGIDANGTILKLYADNSYIEWDGDDLKLPADTDIVRDDGTGNFVSVLGGGIGNISNSTIPTTDPNTLASSDSAAFINFAGGMSGTQLGLGTNDGSLVVITTDGGASTFEFTAYDGAGSIKFPDGTIQTTAAAPAFSFSVAADDSTQRLISNNELIKFIGAGGITTASDAEGNITISKISELVSVTVPTIGGTASAGEAGITYLSGGLTKWAIFTEGAFTVGEWTDVQPGWTVTDNNGFTDTIAGRGSFGAASFSTTVNNWPSPASGKTYVFTSPDYQAGYTDPIEITVGSNDWTFDANGNLTLPSGFITSNAVTGTNLRSGYDVSIISNHMDVDREWIFDSYGDLTIPGNIRSEGSINIDINLSDSTLRRWRFGEDGDLTFPNGGHIGPSGGKGEGTTYGGANDHLVSLTSYYNSGLYSSCVTAYADGTLNITAYNDGGPNPAKIWTFDNTGTLTLPDNSGIKSSTNIDITIDTPDSSTFNWRFGADGDLTLPNGMTIDSSGDLGSNAFVRIGGNNTRITIDDNGAPPGIVMATDITGTGNYWLFSSDGITSLPGDLELNSTGNIRGENGINIDVNLSDSTLHRWSFGEDGELTLPGGRTRIGTAVGVDAIIANEDEAFGVVTQGTNGSGVLIWIEDPENFGTSNLAAVYTNPEGSGTVRIATGANGPGGGPKFWTFYDSGALTFPQGTTIATADGTDAFLIDGAVDKDVQIYTYSGETARGWTFGTDGDLEIPGNIKSEGNINIDINLADSTLRRWQFGEDGDTVFPNNVSINYSGGNVQFPRIIADSGKAFSVQAQGTSGSAALAWTVDPDAAGQYAAVGVSRAGGDNLAKVVLQAQSNSGDAATAKVWKFDETGALTIPGDIKSENAINIDINLTDSTLRRWSFGEDGHLIFPGGTNIIESSANSLGIYSNNPTRTNGLEIFGNTETNLFNQSKVRIISNVGTVNRVWEFGTNGSLTFPDATVQSTAFTTSPTLNILKIDDGVHEKYQELADATGTVTHDCSAGHIFYHASPDANWTVNLTNLNLSVSYATTVTIIIDQGGTGYYPNALQIGGSAQTINWQGNATPTPSSNRHDVVTFSILAFAGGYTVFGQMTGF
jgi:hypothetical protein